MHHKVVDKLERLLGRKVVKYDRPSDAADCNYEDYDALDARGDAHEIPRILELGPKGFGGNGRNISLTRPLALESFAQIFLGM